MGTERKQIKTERHCGCNSILNYPLLCFISPQSASHLQPWSTRGLPGGSAPPEPPTLPLGSSWSRSRAPHSKAPFHAAGGHLSAVGASSPTPGERFDPACAAIGRTFSHDLLSSEKKRLAGRVQALFRTQLFMAWEPLSGLMMNFAH